MGIDVTVQALDRFLEPGYLADRLGQPVEIASLRVKPGTSLLAALRTSSPAGLPGGSEAKDGQPPAWVRLMWPAGSRKVVRHQQKAQALGLEAPVVDAALRFLPGAVLQVGPLAADPKLMKPLAATGVLTLPAAQVLRYNPARRAVVAYRDMTTGGTRVVRVLAGGQVADIAVHQFLAEHLPVPDCLPADSATGLPALAFVGEADLSKNQTPEQAEAAGALFARLHAVTPSPDLAQHLEGAQSDGAQQLQVHAAVLDSLAPDLAARCFKLAGRLPSLSGQAVLVHGDASPDQVLTEGRGAAARYWLTDFDRAHLAPAATDLGSYLATSDSVAGAAFLQGYYGAGGNPVAGDQIQLATAHALAHRLTAPLRAGQPSWRTDIAHQLTRLEELL
ncbi:aminoglycoside phosphotransferase family protein [Rothia nasimurium]|uniref:aminoglycoside phosphotransferase family protein n=1 Tax=Rothia nasimurium TaxID=85336 RepID=UPI003BA0E3F2